MVVESISHWGLFWHEIVPVLTPTTSKEYYAVPEQNSVSFDRALRLASYINSERA